MSHCSSWKIKGISLVTALFFSLVGFQKSASAQDGEKLFKQNCAACHHPTKVVVGPALKGVVGRWEAAGVKDRIYEWIKNPKAVIDEGLPYVKNIVEQHRAKNVADMTPQGVTNQEIDAILAYVETAPEGGGGATAGGYNPHPAGYFDQEEETGNWWLWFVVLGTIFMIIAFGMGGVRQQLTRAQLDKLGQPQPEDTTYWGEARRWMWRNKKLTSVIGLVLVFMLLADGWYALKDIGVYEGYKPKQPIWFSHEVHAGLNKINCQYCHSTVEKSRHASLPSPMVCMNCHKGVQEGTITGKEEIAKIYKAVGFDPASGTYTGKTEPIKWVKVHALPDHVYFNHSQHVVAGKLDCKQCHGEMEKIDVARIQPASVLNAIEGNIKIVDRPTLTMGWCIDCHKQAKVQMEGSGYYDEMKKRLLKDKELYQKHLDDENITVRDIGGWECSKCHY